MRGMMRVHLLAQLSSILMVFDTSNGASYGDVYSNRAKQLNIADRLVRRRRAFIAFARAVLERRLSAA